MTYTAETWPIAAALLQFPSVNAVGRSAQDAPTDEWGDVFAAVRDAGFRHVDVTDSWVRPGDLSHARLERLRESAASHGLGIASMSAIRSSVIDEQRGAENLAYLHRTVDAAVRLGAEVLSIGLHQALTAQQRSRLWFWTARGHVDPEDGRLFPLAVERIRDLGRHAASVGLLLSLELYEDTYLGSADSSVRLVEEVGLANVGLNPDIGNLIRLPRPVESWKEIAEKTLPYTNYWHVKNYQRDEQPERDLYSAIPSPLESGIIDYRDVFATAIENGFQGVVCTEHYGGDGLSVSASNREYLRSRVLPKDDGYTLGSSRVAQGRQVPST